MLSRSGHTSFAAKWRGDGGRWKETKTPGPSSGVFSFDPWTENSEKVTSASHLTSFHTPARADAHDAVIMQTKCWHVGQGSAGGVIAFHRLFVTSAETNVVRGARLGGGGRGWEGQTGSLVGGWGWGGNYSNKVATWCHRLKSLLQRVWLRLTNWHLFTSAALTVHFLDTRKTFRGLFFFSASRGFQQHWSLTASKYKERETPQEHVVVSWKVLSHRARD